MRVFGPIPSRRLGRSLGINNIPPKVCTYSCIYCQLGRTDSLETERRVFYQPDDILREVDNKIEKTIKSGEYIDYLTFVSDGEPTLDKNLGLMLMQLKSSGVKTAVITNSSLIWKQDVREDLSNADWVSLKIDAAVEEIWKSIDRPRGSLRLSDILDGMLEFADGYQGQLATETMLVAGINDNTNNICLVADFIARLNPDKIYLSIPTRPPAEKSVKAPDEETINKAYNIFSDKNKNVEYLIGYEGNAFAFTGDTENDLLSITSVHPMRKDAVQEFLKKADAGWETVDKLLKEHRLIELKYDNKIFYMRKLRQEQVR